MNIKRLVIENFKSIEKIVLEDPNPFTVFVGPNGSGKSNIFEALEFVNLSYKIGDLAESLFGGKKSFLNRHNNREAVNFNADLGSITVSLQKEKTGDDYESEAKSNKGQFKSGDFRLADQFYDSFSRIFIKNIDLKKLSLMDDQRLSLPASNLEKVLKRVLTNDVLKAEIFEWLEIFVPEFKAIEIDERDELHWFEQFTPDYFTKDLISDGTYNILALLTAVYQSDDKPQFLCIEEPENGLHPQVARELVDFFRIMCEERGHHIWLNTHSQSMISRLRPEEMVVVEKKQGKTQIIQYQGRDFHGLRMDEALLMNVLGAGLPW